MLASGVDNHENLSWVSSAELALKSIKEAEAAGADVSGLVRSFNEALDLIQRAERTDSIICSSEDCVVKSVHEFTMIVHKAYSLKEKAQAQSEITKFVNMGIYAPFGAFAASIIIFYSHNAWKSSQLKRLLNMYISEKEN